MKSLFLGLMIVIAASLLQGGFLILINFIRTWKWENSLLFFSIFGLIVFNLLFVSATIPGLSQIFRSAWPDDIVEPLVFGILFGVGIILFRRGITSVGFPLGFSLISGMMLCSGTFIPMLILHPAAIMRARGLIILAGILVVLMGTGLGCYAVLKKERSQKTSSDKITTLSHPSGITGILLCLLSGLCLSSMNIGFALSKPLVKNALYFGVPEHWAGNLFWFVFLISAGVPIIIYSIISMRVHKSIHNYALEGTLKNFILILVVSFMLITSIILYGMGATIMGAWGTITGWLVYITFSISFVYIRIIISLRQTNRNF